MVSTKTTAENSALTRDDLLKRLAALEAVQRWIPVSERLPVNQRVLAYTPKQHISIEYRIIPEGITASDATHWMPLPAPPEEQGE